MSAALIGSSAGSAAVAAAAFACVASTAAARCVRRWITKASTPAPPPSARNGSIGMPGSSDMMIITADDMPSAVG